MMQDDAVRESSTELIEENLILWCQNKVRNINLQMSSGSYLLTVAGVGTPFRVISGKYTYV